MRTGRNLRQCWSLANSMLETDLSPPRVPNLKKRKSGDLLGDPVQKRLASMPQAAYPHASLLPSQPSSLPHPPPQFPMPIQPRPLAPTPTPASESKQVSSTEGFGVYQSTTPSNGYSMFQSNPAARKRGRPSKADKEAQARVNVGSLGRNSPVPISPKPAIQPIQGHGEPIQRAPIPGAPTIVEPLQRPSTQREPSQGTPTQGATIPTAGTSYSQYAEPSMRGGPGGQRLPPLGNYQQYPERIASAIKSENSPTIENLVSIEPPAERQQRGQTEQAGSLTRESLPQAPGSA